MVPDFVLSIKPTTRTRPEKVMTQESSRAHAGIVFFEECLAGPYYSTCVVEVALFVYHVFLAFNDAQLSCEMRRTAPNRRGHDLELNSSQRRPWRASLTRQN